MDKNAVRKALFTPCKSKEELDRWIRVFLNIRFPDKIVSDESNSSPLEMIWQLYDRAVRNDTEGWKSVMVYANRFGGKTLAAAVLETVIVLHTRRNLVHMAAIKDQSKKAQEYVKGFFYLPYLKDFVVGDNDTEVVVVAYENRKTGIPLTEKEYLKLSPSKQEEYRRKENYIRIIVCTMQSTNGQHVEFMVVDEVDVIPKGNLKAYDQAKNGVPTDRGDLEAMTLFTSTRKSRIGKVQAEIDDSTRSGLRVNHWNIIDITEPCPPTRHRPEEPKQTYWVSDADVSHISEYQYDLLPESDKSRFYALEGYAGCAKCPLFAACKGRLATEQEGHVGEFLDGGTALLLKIDSVIAKFRAATPEFITTEFLCRKPDTSGLVYPRFNAGVHIKTPNAIAEEVNGAPVPEAAVFDKQSLLSYLVDKGAKFVSGMDFGYNHLFAVVTLAVWGNKAYVVDAVGLPKQELDDKLELTAHLRNLNSTIFGDPEDPASITTFKRKGYRMKEWSKNAGSVKAGIEIVRAKLYSKSYGSTLTFMSDDGDIATLVKHIQDYHYTTGQDGKFTEEPDDTDDDYPDALRYAVMNTFGKNGALKSNLGLAAVSEATKEEHWTAKVHRMNANAMGNLVRSLTNGESGNTPVAEPGKAQSIKRGGFYWDNG